jgi:hypothetical protein
MTLVQIARLYLFVRETKGANRGVWVELFLKYTDNQPGDSWCCSFVCFCLSIYYQGNSPLTKTASCATLLGQAQKLGYLLPEGALIQPGDLFFYLNAAGHAHHVGIVTDYQHPELIGIAGNTSEDGKSDNGTGVFEHAVGGRKAIVRLPAPK